MPAIRDEIMSLCGIDISRCYQCRRCSNACPVVEFMDIHPARLVAQMLAGDSDAALSSQMIWICTSCRACSTRCPRAIDFARVVDFLRTAAVRSGIEPAQAAIARYHVDFMAEVRRHGRHRTHARELFALFDRGLALVLRGRLRGILGKSDNRRVIEEAFDLEKKYAGRTSDG